MSSIRKVYRCSLVESSQSWFCLVIIPIASVMFEMSTENHPFAMEDEKNTKIVRIPFHLLSRMLYPNPVCLLTVHGDNKAEARIGLHNVMPLTWLTPIDNNGGFICSVNQKRYSASFLHEQSTFVLNVPISTTSSRETVWTLGTCSGRQVNKIFELGLTVCRPGWKRIVVMKDEEALHSDDTLEELEKSKSTGEWTNISVEENAKLMQKEAKDAKAKKRSPQPLLLSKKTLREQKIVQEQEQNVALTDCVAHLLCQVERKESRKGHYILTCQQLAAWCREEYWDGKVFFPRSKEDSPYMTFLGSQTFANVTRFDGFESESQGWNGS